MDEQGTFAAELLDSGIRALAADVVDRQQKDHGGLEGVSFEEWRGETEVRLRYLGEALAAGAPGLFASHVEWARAAYAARGLPDGLLAANLRALRETVGEELPEGPAQAVRRCVDPALPAAEGAPDEHAIDPGGPHAERAGRLLLALLEGRRRDAIDGVVTALDAGLGIGEIHSEVIARAQVEMGRLWQRGEVHIGEEHLGSRIVEEALAVLRHRVSSTEAVGRRVITASVRGDLHDIGARMVADAFELAGWSSLFLGANVPEDDLAASLRDFEADVLALSVSLGLHVRSAAATVAAVREAVPHVRILVGGGPFAATPGLWESVGADGWAASAEAAVAEAERLLGAS